MTHPAGPDGVRRLVLHVGLAKTGTTFVQNTWRVNRDELARQGVIYPGGPGRPVQRLAVWDLVGHRPGGEGDKRVTGQWAALRAQLTDDDARTVLLSEEYLASVGPGPARKVATALPGRETHVVVTVRDLGRTLWSSWVEEVKDGATLTWPEYAARVCDPRALARDPARGFWLKQDLAAVLGTWGRVVDPDRLHVVTVPPPGADDHLLLERLGAVVGYEASRLTERPPHGNLSLGPALTEVVRRANPALRAMLEEREYDHVVKELLPRHLGGGGRTPVDRAVAERLAEEADRLAGVVRQGGYGLVGDLADLRVEVGPSEAASQQAGASETGPAGSAGTSEAEVAEAAVAAFAMVAGRHGRLWWRTRSAGHEETEVTGTARLGSRARTWGLRGRRAVARAADRSRLVAWAIGPYLRRRGLGRR